MTAHRVVGGAEVDYFYLAGFYRGARLIVVAETSQGALTEEGRVRAELVIEATAGYVPTGRDARTAVGTWEEYKRVPDEDLRRLYQATYGKPYGEWGQ